METEPKKIPTPRRWWRRLWLLLATIGIVLLLSAAGVWLFLEFRPPPITLRVLPKIALPGHGILSFADYPTVDGNRLYVGYTTKDELVVIDTARGNVVAVVKGLKDIHGCAIDPADHVGFTSNGGEDTVGVINLDTDSLVTKVPGGKGPDAIIFDAKDHLVYAADGEGKTATLIDPVTRSRVATIALGGSPEYPVADPSTGLVYQNLEDTNEVVVVDPIRRVVLARYTIGPGKGPTGIALDATGHRLFVVCGNKKLVILDENSGRLVASLPIGAGVDGVGFDPVLKRIYTANSAATMTVVQQDGVGAYHILENAPTPLGGHSLAVDPATHRIYVICAGIGSSKVAVFEPNDEASRPGLRLQPSDRTAP